MSPPTAQSPKIGLALSGGSLKAAAHVGVLGALEDMGIRPSCIAGTSAGAFVAAMYAHGYTYHELTQLIRRFPGASLFDYGFPLFSSLWSLWTYRWSSRNHNGHLHMPNGLMRGKRLENYFRSHLEHRKATLPFFIIATDLLSGKPAVYSNDEMGLKLGFADPVPDLAKTVLGSCCLPGVMTPVRVDSKLLVDGAFRHYVPVDILRQAGCDKIIAVNLYHLQTEWQPETFAHILARSFEILLQENIDGDIDGKDTIVIQPNVGHLSWISFERMDACVEEGRKSVQLMGQRIEAMIRAPSALKDRLSKDGELQVPFRIQGRAEKQKRILH